MDRIALAVLQAELEADSRVIKDAGELARARFKDGSPEQMEACAYQLTRLYNVVEQAGLRIAKVFENQIDDDAGWHIELLRRLSIAIPGVRPAFLEKDLIRDLQELRGFRHVIRHAYDLELNKNRMIPLLNSAERVAAAWDTVCHRFLEQVQEHISSNDFHP